jgi:hypothetical protein
MPDPSRSFAIVALEPHQSPPENHIAWGSGSLIGEFLDARHHRARADAALRRADAASENLAERERRLGVQSFKTLDAAMAHLSKRIDALEARHAERARVEEAAEARRIEDELAKLPDPDADPAFHGHAPSSDLHDLAPVEERSPPGEDAAMPGDPSRPGRMHDQGPLPTELRRGAPAQSGNYPFEGIDRPRPRYQQPTSVSLNEGDDF